MKKIITSLIVFLMAFYMCVPVQAGTNHQNFQTGKSLMIVQAQAAENETESEPSSQYKEGYEDGWQKGWKDGYSEGCDSGYEAGVEAGIFAALEATGCEDDGIKEAVLNSMFWERYYEENPQEEWEKSDYEELYTGEIIEYPVEISESDEVELFEYEEIQ